MKKVTNNRFGFDVAICNIKDGYRVSRDGWNGKGMYLSLQTPDENSKMKQPYIFIVPSESDVIPWVASQRDLLSNDWFVVDEDL